MARRHNGVGRRGAWLGQIGVFTAIVVGLVLLMPLLALAVFVGRLAVLVGLTVVIFVALLSPPVRARISAWLRTEPVDTQVEHRGVRLPAVEFLHAGHSWAKVEGDEQVSVGADDLVHRLLGPAETVQLPAVGTHVQQGLPLFRLERAGRAITVTSPVTGTITTLNAELLRAPSVMGADPYGAGWAVRVRPTSLRVDRRELLGGSMMREWLRGEVERVVGFVVGPLPAHGALMQDGGALTPRLAEHMDPNTWHKLVRTMFGHS